ncbi:MAG: phosphoadenosine phosphosulfate reductase family protein [Selenomonadaceae bacterium]|nr:phosphoadenosine phosphosulfate reductase family protein [Selenomonadaceae bacterium]
MREPPPFAIMEHPLVPYAGYCNYQTFCNNRTRDGIQMIGLRTAESIQRLKAVAFIKRECRKQYPIYDWKDTDVWLYIKENHLPFPEAYIRLYEAGVTRTRLRLCCFFGDSSIQGLRWIAETDPELWVKIERRYPNAYLVLLYWDSEMFKRQSRRRTNLEDDSEPQDYKAKLYDLLFLNTDKYTIPPDTFKTLKDWRRLVIGFSEFMSPKLFKTSCEAILSGDPKKRTFRAVYNETYLNIANQSRKEQAHRDKR